MTIPKFRAWFKREQRMIESYDILAIDYENEEIVTQKIYSERGLAIERDIHSHDFDDVNLMQSTGLKDINGKEIYEGDVVKLCFEEDGLFEICLDTVGGFYTKSVLTEKIQFLEASDFDELETAKEVFNEYVEFVGNVHENPDLLDKVGIV